MKLLTSRVESFSRITIQLLNFFVHQSRITSSCIQRKHGVSFVVVRLQGISCKAMISRLTIALPVALIGAALLAPSLPAQGRGGMHAAPAAARGRSVVRLNGRAGSTRGFQRGYLNEPYLFPPYYYGDDDFYYEDEYSPPGQYVIPPPVQVISSQRSQSPPPPATPVEPLLLEIRDGQWVRVPTGSQMALPQSAKPDSPQGASQQVQITEPAESAAPLPELPPAVIVFRDGHTEEVAKYMIQGTVLFTSADYWSTGNWTRKIPLSEIDIPASLKINKERGTKFNLPTGPNEIVIRF